VLKFRTVPGPIRDEHVVIGEDPASGNDSALIAVFNSSTAATNLADLLNFVAALKEQCDCSGPGSEVKIPVV
jgi:hypothetical protein